MGNLFEDVEPLNVSSSTVRPGGYAVPVPVAVGDTVRCVQRGANVNITVGTEYRVVEVGGGTSADDPGLRYSIENNAGVRRWYRAEYFERVAGDTVERRAVTTGEYAGVEQRLMQHLRRAVHDEVVIDAPNLHQLSRGSLEALLDQVREQALRLPNGF